MQFAVDGAREISRFILQLGAAVKVVEPDWLDLGIAAFQVAF